MNDEEKQIRQDPYTYIQNWAEKNLICVGRQAFKILALCPMSLFLPNIPFNSSSIRATINVLLIGNPGSGKSTLLKKESLLSYNPLLRRSISDADLSDRASELKWVTVILEDFSETVEAYGYGVVKVLEGIMGDEQNINKSNMRNEYTGEVKAVGILGITPQDLEKYAKLMESGLLSRCFVSFIKLKSSDYIKIAEHVNDGAGDTEQESKMRIIENSVIDFYEELRWIQRGKHKEFLESKKWDGKIIEPIIGYKFNQKFKEELSVVWKKFSTRLIKSNVAPSIRNLHEYYRILIASAFLNIYNRECKNGILVPNEIDHKLALEMMTENMKYKFAIPIAINGTKKASNLESLEKLLNQGIPEYIKDVMINISPYGKFLKDG